MLKESIFDREQYLDILEKRIGSLKDGYRQNLAIIGDELVGKTSIICKFLNSYYDNRTIIIYLEIRPEALISFAKRFIGVLLYNFLINSEIPLKEDLDFLIKKSERYIPKTIEKIKLILSALEKRRRNNIFAELLILCEIIHQETAKFCVVIFDEFHNLEKMGIKNLYPEWSKLLISQKNTIYIIVSSMKFKTKAILAKNLSLLFGNFEMMPIDPFDIKTSEEYLDFNLSESGLNSGERNFIVHFTGGFPFYLNIIIEALLKSGNENLPDMLEDLLFESSGILNQRFSNYLKRFLDSPNSQDYLSTLYLIASGHNKFGDIAHILRKPKKELMLKINYLLEFDTISRNGDFLKINDRVFSFWLKFVYQQKLRSLTFDAKNQKIYFRENLEDMINEFIINARRPVIERITEVMNLFADDTIQIENKRLKLNHFREIKALEFNNVGLKEGILGRSNDSLWIIAFKNDLLTEDDVSEFAKECKKYHHRPQRKIIVSFKDIDSNARLRAMEEKILTWNLNNLNQILDIFYKPRIII